MKKTLFFLITATAISLTACNESSNTESDTTDSTSTVADNSEATPMGASNYVSPYLDLKTNQTVNIGRDSVKNVYVNSETNDPLTYYYDPIAHDTFDSRGRLVNNALILTDGNYTTDEVKVKSNDDAFKAKYEDIKVKMDNNSAKMKSDDMKIKDKEDKYKEKTDSTKLKVTDDEIKMKEK